MVTNRDGIVLTTVAALALLGQVHAGLAATASGTAVAVIQSTYADGATGNRMLTEKDDVYSGDRITTGPVGQAQILFRDNTKLVVGPNSSLTVDAFVYSGQSAQKVSIDAVKGAFRFITGISKKDAYSISTPTAVIAVRGTEFDFNVDRAGFTEVVMFGGATSICPKTLPDGSPNTKRQGCVLASRKCNMTLVPPGGDDIAQLKPSQQRNAIINSDFRYIRDQTRLEPGFRVDLASCGAPANFLLVPPGSPGSSAPPSVPPPPPPPPSDGGDG